MYFEGPQVDLFGADDEHRRLQERRQQPPDRLVVAGADRAHLIVCAGRSPAAAQRKATGIATGWRVKLRGKWERQLSLSIKCLGSLYAQGLHARMHARSRPRRLPIACTRARGRP